MCGTNTYNLNNLNGFNSFPINYNYSNGQIYFDKNFNNGMQQTKNNSRVEFPNSNIQVMIRLKII